MAIILNGLKSSPPSTSLRVKGDVPVHEQIQAKYNWLQRDLGS